MILAEISGEATGPASEGVHVSIETSKPVSLAGIPAALTPIKVRYDLSIVQSLRRIIRGVSLYSHQLMATYKITAPQLICLLTIINDGPLNSSALSKRVFLSASTVVGILDRLEEKGLITRQRSHRDRRVINVQATPEGVELAANAPSPLPTRLSEALKQLTELEQATIALSLQRVVYLMEEHAPEATGHADSAPEIM